MTLNLEQKKKYSSVFCPVDVSLQKSIHRYFAEWNLIVDTT